MLKILNILDLIKKCKSKFNFVDLFEFILKWTYIYSKLIIYIF